jgi:hypothetical protein
MIYYPRLVRPTSALAGNPSRALPALASRSMSTPGNTACRFWSDSLTSSALTKMTFMEFDIIPLMAIEDESFAEV